MPQPLLSPHATEPAGRNGVAVLPGTLNPSVRGDLKCFSMFGPVGLHLEPGGSLWCIRVPSGEEEGSSVMRGPYRTQVLKEQKFRPSHQD